MKRATHSMVRALEWRERKTRSDLARSARALEKGRNTIATLDALITEIEARTRASIATRFAAGSRTVAALLDVEQHATSLRAEQGKLSELMESARTEIEELVKRQLEDARHWQRSEVKLQHAQSLIRKLKLERACKTLESDDQEYTERSLLGRRTP